MRIFSNFIIVFFIIFLSFNHFSTASEKVTGKNGMVVSDHELASKVGIEILRNGGNAIDAAVGVGFALAVTFPYAGNIGGGGFMVIHFENGSNTAIDFREVAPQKAAKDMYLDTEGNYNSALSQEGITSVAIPGSVDGLLHTLNKYGKLSLKDVIQPAIDLALNGFILEESQVLVFNKYYEKLNSYKSSSKIFYNYDKQFKSGDKFIQSDLGKTLERIRDFGRDGFYSGKTADLIIKQVKRMGGIIAFEDLKKYKSVERDCIKGNYNSYSIISMPPPSSGGIAIVEALNILDNFEISKDQFGSSKYYHLLTESLKYVYADRSKHIGDPDFYNVPINNLVSSDYADIISKNIGAETIPSDQIAPSELKIIESDETTHYSVIDSEGNAVSVTTTVNSAFGSKIIVDGAGFLLNNEMDDFSAKPGEPNQFGLLGSEANSIQPGKRMVSSMSPTIVLKEDKPILVLGSPGGSKIITSVLQTILNVIKFDMDIEDAVNLPRIHHQWMPDSIYYDNYAITSDVKINLLQRGHKIKQNSSVIGRVNAIFIDEKNIFWGHSDKRGYGKAVGY